MALWACMYLRVSEPRAVASLRKCIHVVFIGGVNTILDVFFASLPSLSISLPFSPLPLPFLPHILPPLLSTSPSFLPPLPSLISSLSLLLSLLLSSLWFLLPPFLSQSASNGLKAQMYYPSRPRSHSAGSQGVAIKKTTVKVVMGRTYGKAKSLEDGRKPPQCSTSRYKTELCRPFQEYGFCKYGDKCQFAHGEQDLRVLPRHPKYKTELCRTYHSTGFCPYGPRCHFIHNMEEARQPPETPPRSPTKKSSGSFSSSLPISPSLDSGISSPDGYFGGRSFEFPIVGSQSSGSDEGEERNTKQSAFRYTYSPLGDCDLESTESGLQQDISSPDLFVESDVMSSSSGSSPLKPMADRYATVSDPAMDLHHLLLGLGIEEEAMPSSPAPNGSNSRRLPVFDDMMNSKSDSALLSGHSASDPGRASHPVFP